MLTGESPIKQSATIYNGGASNSVYVSPFHLDNQTTGQYKFLAFCGDFNTSVPSTFATQAVEYNAVAFSDIGELYTANQKNLINDLFGYAYGSAFGSDGSIINSVNAQAFQLALWSILYETEDYDIMKGSFHLGTNYNSDVVNTTNSWLDAVTGNVSWSDIGLETFTKYDLTVYMPAGGVNASQVLISVVGPPVVPEPATMLVVGLGLAGIGLTRRWKQK